MANLQLNAIATRFLLDDEFQRALLREHRADCLSGFTLSDHERRAILSIRAETTRQFLNELRKLMRPASRPWALPPTGSLRGFSTTSPTSASGAQSY